MIQRFVLLAALMLAGNLQAIDEAGKKRLVQGKHTLHIGGVSPGQRGKELTGAALKTASCEMR